MSGHGEKIEGTDLRVSKNVAGPRGSKYTAVFRGKSTILTSLADPHETIVITGGAGGGGGSTTAELSVSGILGGIGDALLDALGALKKLVSCQPVTTTTVNVGSDGKITSVTTTTTCVPG